MKIEIEVTSQSDDAFLLEDLMMKHKGCESEKMQYHRNPATDVHTLRCACGVELSFPSEGEAMAAIQLTAIYEQPRELNAATFWCQPKANVTIVRA